MLFVMVIVLILKLSNQNPLFTFKNYTKSKHKSANFSFLILKAKKSFIVLK